MSDRAFLSKTARSPSREEPLDRGCAYEIPFVMRFSGQAAPDNICVSGRQYTSISPVA